MVFWGTPTLRNTQMSMIVKFVNGYESKPWYSRYPIMTGLRMFIPQKW